MNNNHYKLYPFIIEFEKQYNRKPKFFKIKVRRGNSESYSYLSYPNRNYFYYGFYNRASRYLGITLSELCLNRDILLLYLAYHDNILMEIDDYDEIFDHLLFCTPDEFGNNNELKNKQLNSDFGFCIAPSENRYLAGEFDNLSFYKLQNPNTGDWLCFNLKNFSNPDLAIVISEEIMYYKKYKEIVGDTYIPKRIELPTTYTHIFYNFEDFGFYINNL